MYIIILGAGTVGYHLARQLSQEGHDIYIIDSNQDRIQEIEEGKGLDAITLVGNGGSPDMLIQAGVKKADLLVAVTDADETNIIACMIASTLGVESRVARVRSHEYFKRDSILQPIDLGIDLLINPEDEAAREIVALLERPYATDRRVICNGKLELVGINVGPACPIVDKSLRAIDSMIEQDFRISLILREGKPIIPHGDTVVEYGDKIFFMALAEDIDPMVRTLDIDVDEIRNVFIMGGGTIGVALARHFENEKKVRARLIESRKDKALRLSEVLTKTLLLEGDGTNVDLLLAEGIREADAFMAVTGHEEVNILSCLLAKQQGVKNNIALVQRADYVPIITAMDLSVISSRVLTVDKILKFVRGKKVLSISTLAEDKAEVLEFKVTDKSPIQGKALRDFTLPADAILGAIIRNGEPIIPTGDTVILPNDSVFVFALKEDVDAVSSVF